ncbi:hypothetical protein SELMODRAFT_183978 [Selaginella moellendorffii]|uniref:Uncharacterized protein APY-2 n=1 Tax=Selaginella moellendorffii TaxID=88036 RepID=D8SZ22_SELML|nr:probable apyrase 2 [Selaginella moellendorffii]EFJ10325.1 hypothetical protein SELMODRAFT_183978 [Selaginella moellendorffii]|eukprot:XP_024518143.1 probable apyrase 2 [Selaginella moellendorffii]
MRRMRHESSQEKFAKYRGVLLLVSIPLGLILAVMLLMPRSTLENGAVSITDPFDREAFGSQSSFAVIFDAGSSGSRVHVFRFSSDLELLAMDNGLELFRQLKPGLSYYASDPRAAANSLKPLLDAALKVVPENLQGKTPVRLGATAGLRTLPGGKANEILEEVRDLLTNSSFKFDPSWVSILDGADEGSFQWVTVNYLLGRLGKDLSETVGIVDLGGGSVQMAYAITEEDAAKAPKAAAGEDAYVKTLTLLGKTYYLYVHSYLHYGLLAARAEVLRLVKTNDENPCVTSGFKGQYVYGSETFDAVGGADFDRCSDLIVSALEINHTCNYLKCTFKGIWSGGGGAGQKKLFVASFFFDRASEIGIIKDPQVSEAVVEPSQFRDAATSICSTSYEDMPKKFPGVPELALPYICMDVLYQYDLLVKGFGIPANEKITLVKRVQYKGYEVEAAWPLGSAIEVVSGHSSSTHSLQL